MTQRLVDRNTRVIVFFEVTRRSLAELILNAGLYERAVQGSRLLASASDPSTPTHWAGFTSEREEFGQGLPGLLVAYDPHGVDAGDDRTWRVRYHDAELTQPGAGYCMTSIYDDTTRAWRELVAPETWLASMGLVFYEPDIAPDADVDPKRLAALTADVPVSQAERDALIGEGGVLEAAMLAAYAAQGLSPAALREGLSVGEVNARIMARAE